MKYFFQHAAIVTLLVTSFPGVADAFTSMRGAKVNPVNAAVFEVVPRSGGSGLDYWCGAGDYAQRALRAAWTAPIYIARGLGTSVTTGRRSAVQFTLDPVAAGVTPIASGISINALRVGESMTVRQAFNYCEKKPTR